jgi:hypothetical protein
MVTVEVWLEKTKKMKIRFFAGNPGAGDGGGGAGGGGVAPQQQAAGGGNL